MGISQAVLLLGIARTLYRRKRTVDSCVQFIWSIALPPHVCVRKMRSCPVRWWDLTKSWQSKIYLFKKRTRCSLHRNRNLFTTLKKCCRVRVRIPIRYTIHFLYWTYLFLLIARIIKKQWTNVWHTKCARLWRFHRTKLQ